MKTAIFTKVVSSAVPLQIDNIDTDQIIPARFLKATNREGFGENLFCDWRSHEDGSLKAEFPLNNPAYRGRILVAGKNFGCGSSREHAAWAIFDHGFRVVVSSFFGDIFKSNSLNNGLLPVTVDQAFLDTLFEEIAKNPAGTFTVDLNEQHFKIDRTGESVGFEINPYKKTCFLNGYDDVEYVLSQDNAITFYESKQSFNF